MLRHPLAPHLRHEPTEAEIQKQAYHLWIEGGCLEGVELDNWLAAKELLRHRHAHSSSRAHLPVRPVRSSQPPVSR